jgi:uncharacterized phage protein (TIGR01671 family)
MREFKFRGISKKTGKWIHGYYLKNRGVDFIAPDEFAGDKTWEDYEVIPETVGQFSGLLDKNGKEIYEGDIVRKKEIGGYGYEYIGVVRYYDNDCRFGIDLTATDKFSKRVLFTDGEVRENDGYCTITYTLEYEVLGNVFDNPELLKTETL